MTEDEARAVAKIIGTADNGCDTCVGWLVDKLNRQFPAYVWSATNERVEYTDADGPHNEGLVVKVWGAP